MGVTPGGGGKAGVLLGSIAVAFYDLTKTRWIKLPSVGLAG